MTHDERGGSTYAELAQTFGMGEATVPCLLRRRRERGVLCGLVSASDRRCHHTARQQSIGIVP